MFEGTVELPLTPPCGRAYVGRSYHSLEDMNADSKAANSFQLGAFQFCETGSAGKMNIGMNPPSCWTRGSTGFG